MRVLFLSRPSVSPTSPAPASARVAASAPSVAPSAPFRVGDVWTSPRFVVDPHDVEEHRSYALAEALDNPLGPGNSTVTPALGHAPSVLVLAHALTALRRHPALRGAEVEALSTGSVAALGHVEVGEPLLAVAVVRFLGAMREAHSVTVTVGVEVRRARGGTAMRAELGLEVRLGTAVPNVLRGVA